MLCISLPGLKATGQQDVLMRILNAVHKLAKPEGPRTATRPDQSLERCACLQGLRLIDLYTKKGVDTKRIYIKVMP